MKNTQESTSWINPLGSVISTPTKAVLPAQSLAVWLPWWNSDVVLSSLSSTNPDIVSSVSPLWYYINQKGSLESYTVAKRTSLDEVIEKKEFDVIPTIGNDFDAKRVHALLSDDALQTEFINDLLQIADEHGYLGWDFDWEELEVKDASGYVTFLAQVHERFQEKNLTLIVTVHALTGNQDWQGAKGHDFVQIGRVSDYVRVMAYDYHYSKSDAGPITPLGWYDEVLSYALSTIPKEKLVIGLPLYGYDWVGKKGESLLWFSAQKILTQHKLTPERDSQSQELFVRYLKGSETHEMWWEDAVSVVTKIEKAQQHGLNSFVFWSLGGEDPGVWSLIRSR